MTRDPFTPAPDAVRFVCACGACEDFATQDAAEDTGWRPDWRTATDEIDKTRYEARCPICVADATDAVEDL